MSIQPQNIVITSQTLQTQQNQPQILPNINTNNNDAAALQLGAATLTSHSLPTQVVNSAVANSQIIDHQTDVRGGINIMENTPNNTISNTPVVHHLPQQQQQTTPIATTKAVQGATATSSVSSDNSQILTKQRLQDLVRETDSTLNIEEDVEEIILGYVDEFVDRCLNGAAMIAKNRHGNTLDVKDVQQFLNRNYNMWTPGFGTDELRPYKRSMTTEAHKQRLALIRKTLKKY